jgi:hypothetical protein
LFAVFLAELASQVSPVMFYKPFIGDSNPDIPGARLRGS